MGGSMPATRKGGSTTSPTTEYRGPALACAAGWIHDGTSARTVQPVVGISFIGVRSGGRAATRSKWNSSGDLGVRMFEEDGDVGLPTPLDYADGEAADAKRHVLIGGNTGQRGHSGFWIHRDNNREGSREHSTRKGIHHSRSPGVMRPPSHEDELVQGGLDNNGAADCCPAGVESELDPSSYCRLSAARK
ncbi:hypothetical protein CONLIGDRAFT_650632 [Coniochaeta ligniaria NRRL 30616]|uniref:Uncharacterized protein n=1 Tax=Coniochaeta ligniaria NRRL 30616 TaxID=1408157 RepID=A0A1J7I4A4_9PEZI|nr:hypothetical protein CONLIGDRAFT_650632 [Coniochaeta ligniaria NRRL 30616]